MSGDATHNAFGWGIAEAIVLDLTEKRGLCQLQLPNLENAVIEDRKITVYLLSEENSGGKAAFFLAFGFNLDQPEVLRAALLTHAEAHDITFTSKTPHGIKYIIEGEMQTPDERSPLIRSVWIVDKGKDAPRFVTAYPL